MVLIPGQGTKIPAKKKKEKGPSSPLNGLRHANELVPEGNGTPLQYSCLENPRDGGTWWAAIYGVARSWTRLK